MAIIVEDGSIIAGANSYVTVAEVLAYANDRGINFTGDVEQILFKSMDYVDSQNYKGDRVGRVQLTAWPRINVSVDGFTLPSDEIPREVKTAQFVVAVAIGDGADPLSIVENRGIKVDKLGPMTTEYDTQITAAPFARGIPVALAKLIKGGAFSTVRV